MAAAPSTARPAIPASIRSPSHATRRRTCNWRSSSIRRPRSRNPREPSRSQTWKKIPSSADAVTSRLPLAVLLVLAAISYAGSYVASGFSRTNDRPYVVSGFSRTSAQSPAPDLETNIGNLASLDFATRMNAARRVRRAPADEAVASLTAAVRSHSDQFVRYRALVLLTAFNDRATAALMTEMLADRNDRIREVAYKWLEQHPAPKLAS